MTAQGTRRNLIHLATGVAAPWLLLVPRPWSVLGLALALATAAGLDLTRLSPRARHRLDIAFPGLYRCDEAGTISGATLLAAGYLVAALACPARAAAGGIVALAAGDPAAALVGGWYGRRRGLTVKTSVGSLACFVAAVLAIWLVTGTALPGSVAGGAFGALIERRTGRYDNLALPVGVAMLLDVWTPAG